MGLEVGSFPSDLVDTNPTGTDLKSQGDDHIRLIKKVIKNTFPNLNGAVNATPLQLNSLASPGTVCFPGLIGMWSGAIGSIPSGWVLCNGSGVLSNGNPVPDLRDRFIVGAGSSYGIGATGGATTHTHSVSVNVDNHSLTIAQIPSHSHTVPGSVSSNGGSETFDGNSSGASFNMETSSVGSGAGHSHNASGSAIASTNMPPYFALAYIIKT